MEADSAGHRGSPVQGSTSLATSVTRRDLSVIATPTQGDEEQHRDAQDLEPEARGADHSDGSGAVGVDLRAHHLYLNREISWLQFNARVLALAQDGRLPLLERLTFLAIFSTNLDEFWMVRVSGLREQVQAGIQTRGSDGFTPTETLDTVRRHMAPLIEAQTRCFVDDIVPALAKQRIRLVDIDELDSDELAFVADYFVRQVFPVLTPLGVDPSHPFPYISNLSLSLAVLVRDPSNGRDLFARVKVPAILPRFVAVADTGMFVPLEQVVAAHLDLLFRGMQVLEAHPFRVTRDADMEVAEDEADDLLVAVEQELRRRRFGDVVRLEVAATMPRRMTALLQRELNVDDGAVIHVQGPLNLGDLWALVKAVDRPELAEEPWIGTTQPRLAALDGSPTDLFATIRAGDILLQHPYDSFTSSVEHFLHQAAVDPAVLAIKQTLYRTDGDSAIVSSLIEAAERGKQVAVVVEVKARFDEASNIQWARALEQAGCHVAYGLVGLKTHAKVALVVRREPDGIRRYFHVGTGNYNAKTARLYTDFGLLSCDDDLGADLSDLFNALTGYSHQGSYRQLLVAPSLRSRVVALIHDEIEAHQAHGGGRILMQMNSLVDADCIRALYRASQAGVHVDLIIRGICRLRPRVAGVSEHIRVRSIVGRFLEHQRLWVFGSGDRARYYIGSADLMPRNLDRRIEAVVPVHDPRLRARISDVVAVMLSDNVQAWELEESGTWHRIQPQGEQIPVATHRALRERALQRAAGRSSTGSRHGGSSS